MCTFVVSAAGVYIRRVEGASAPNVHITRADVLICALNVAARRMCELAVSRGHTRCERSVLGVDHDRVVCSLGLQLVRELFQEQFAVLDSLA